MSKSASRRASAIATTSWIAIGVAMACSGAAYAQTATTTATSASTVDEVETVVVVGARASQQSSIDRKRRAKTPTDSIVADDIGSFPDRNINEAISRIAGVALGRNDYGEGDSVSIRGNNADVTRVELDGMGVQSTYGLGLDINNGRSADMRELSADLIKSVDVVKGSTADMTEGGLGGSVLIKTRTGLDFRKPYFSLRVGAEQNSLGKKWTPDINLIASRKFFDDRLGVVANISYRAVETTSHYQEIVTSNNQSYARLFDWDNSAERTFRFNPSTVTGTAASVVLANSVGNETPLSLVTKSANAASKADCVNNLFPYLASGTDAQKQQRLNEQRTCLTQWDDYTPSLLRQFMNSQTDERKALDLRFDYRISDSLTAFVKFNKSDRITDDQNRQRNMNGVSYQTNVAQRTSITTGANGSVASTTNPYQRNINSAACVPTSPPAPNCGNPLATPNTTPGYVQNWFNWTRDTLYPVTDPLYTTTQNVRLGLQEMLAAGTSPNQSTVTTTTTTTATARQTAPVRGIVINIDPNTVTVDANHNVTGYTQYNTSMTINAISNIQPSKTSYVQFGANYAGERMRIDFMAGETKSSTSRVDFRADRSFNYGVANVKLTDAGLWDVIPADPNYNENDTSVYAVVNSATAGTGAITPSANNPLRPRTPAFLVDLTASPNVNQLPMTTGNFSITMRPRVGKSQEQTAQIDLTYDTTDLVPFFTQFKTGFKIRKTETAAWGGGSQVVQDATPGNFSAYYTAATNDGDARRATSAGFQNDLIDPTKPGAQTLVTSDWNNLLSVQANYDANIAAGWRPAIIIPDTNIQGSFRGCEETATSATMDDFIMGVPTLAHPVAETSTRGLCNYGYVATTDFSNTRQGVDTMTRAELEALWVATLDDNGMIPFDGFNGAGRLQPYKGIRVADLFSQLGAWQGLNLDCMIECTANNGQVYQRQKQQGDEEIMNLYGMTFNGNVGLRGVRTKATGTGLMTLAITRITVPASGTTPEQVLTTNFRENVQLTATQIDWLPSYNLNLWVIPDQLVTRYSTARTVARPSIGLLLPAGTCSIDERVNDGGDPENDTANTCSGTIGNPELKPNVSKNRTITLEWYPNRDTSFSLAWQKQQVLVGTGRTEQRTGQLFRGTGQIDPFTGNDVSTMLFNYTTQTNAPGFSRTGWEFSAKTAFTFLPWLFRYTGADYNTSTLSTTQQLDATLDPITGDIMRPVGESAYFDNVSLWYDDGRTNARISYQARGERFSHITSAGASRNTPGNNYNNVALPYNPGSPFFTDETAFVDAKISHNLSPNLQIFLEGRNLTKESNSTSSGGYEAFAENPLTGVTPPKIYRLNYAGKRVATGFTYKFQ